MPITILDVLDQARELLRQKGRVTYRLLKAQFNLTDDILETLKDELIEAERVAADENGKVLVWVGDQGQVETEKQGIGESENPTQSLAPNTQPPLSYTPSHLAERIRAEQAAMESRGSADGERKTITALFADLKGSTALIEGLDPEEARAIIDPALQLMMDAVHRYDGYVAQALGDGIFALFGAPIAHEDHPQRALYAALRMQEEMRRYSDQVRLKHGAPLYMRVGVNTGEVVVRSIRKDDLHTDYVPVGHSTNLAARMEQMATPGSIVVTDYTHKLTEGYFEFKGLGAAEIKGVEEALNVYEVLGAGPLRTRLQVSARRGLTRFVGRHSEMDQMQQALEQAKAGHGQIVGVMGDPGLGKSRLFYEFKLTSQSGCLGLEAFSVSYGKASPYLPLIELLKNYFQIEPTDVVQTLAEEGALVGERGNYRLEQAPTELHISPTVQGVLAARIDRLAAEEKELLQQLSVIGRQFPVSLVKQVVLQSEAELYRVLSSLQAKEFLYEQPAFPEVEYIFKHALTQEVAYGTVLQDKRKALHEQTAEAIETLYHSSLEDHYSELAYHYSRSGNIEKAVEYLHKAGQQAVQRSAHEEAVSHFTTALQLLKTLLDTPDRARRELSLQFALGPQLIVRKGYSAPETEQVYLRARELCNQLGETPQLFPVLLGLSAFYCVRGALHTAHPLMEQMLALAQDTQDSGHLVQAHYILGPTLFAMGQFAAARKTAEQGSNLYDPSKHGSHTAWYGQDPGVFCHTWAAMALWHLGYPDRALQRIHSALQLAQELGYPFNVSLVHVWTAALHQLRRESWASQAQAEEALNITTRHGHHTPGMGVALHGWALAEQGQGEAGIAELRQGFAAYRVTGTGIFRSWMFAMLVEAYGKMGLMEKGLSSLAEALETVQITDERFHEAELYRLKGELLLQKAQGSGPKANPNPQPPGLNFPAEAEECFHKAIDIARHQEAKSWELRAATSLARLWQSQGKTDEACELLAPVYNWFTEGFDTADLKDAKALLAELS